MNKLHTLETEEKDLKWRIYAEKRRLHNDMVKHPTYKYILLSMDISMGIILLMNFGALMLTNAMVMKVAPGEPQVQLMEVNPVAADRHDFVEHPEAINIFAGFLSQAMILSLLLFFYIFWRWSIYDPRKLKLLLLWLVILGVFLGSDFLSNFGYWIGRTAFV